MNNQQVMEITNAKNQIDTIQNLNSLFLEHAKANAIPQDIPSKLEVSNQGFAVPCFGFTATATPRIVKGTDGSFAVEYVFSVGLGEEKIEVWRFYLTSGGRVVESIDSDSAASVCDYNNSYIAKHLCSQVLLGALQSPLFTPSRKQGG
jgi:hypothetical protein